MHLRSKIFAALDFGNDLAKLKKFFSLNAIPLFVNSDISQRDRERKYKTKSEPNLRGKSNSLDFGGFSEILIFLESI